MTVATSVEEGRLRQRITHATSALRDERWAVDELRPLAELLDSILNARRRVDPVGNVAWIVDRRGGER